MIDFARADIGAEEEQAVLSVLRSGWLTSGKVMRDLEELVSDQLGGPHCLAVSSATAGLHLALEALGIRPGDEVLVPTMTFTATAEVVRYLGAVPVLCDVLPGTWNLDLKYAEKRISNRTKAVMPVHYGGRACDLDAVQKFAATHELKVVEDAAHAFGAFRNGTMVGASSSAATVFSFYATKCVTTGEGGMVCTWSDDLYRRMRIMRLHGIDRDATARYKTGAWEYDVIAPGFKYNLPDVLAAIGIEQVRKNNRMRLRRLWIAMKYAEALQGTVQVPPPDLESSWHLYPILVPNRDQFIRDMRAEGVMCSVHYRPLHRMTVWSRTKGQFPVADYVFQHCVSLPIYSSMTAGEVDVVIQAVKECSRQQSR